MTVARMMHRSSRRVTNHAGFVKNIGAVTSGQTTGTTIVVTVPAGGVPAGHVLVVRAASDYLSSASTAADSKGNTYTSVRSSPGTANALRGTLLACAVTTPLVSGDTITVTYGASLVNRVAIVDQFSGVLTPVVTSSNGASAVSTTPQTSLTTTVPLTLLVAMVASNAPVTDAYTQDAGWTGLTRAGTQAGTSPYISIGGAYRLLTSTNTVQYRPVLGASATWVDFIVGFTAT